MLALELDTVLMDHSEPKQAAHEHVLIGLITKTYGIPDIFDKFF